MYLQFVINFSLFIAIVDTYFYLSMRQVLKGADKSKSVPKWVIITYWGFTVFSIAFMLFAIYFFVVKEPPPKFARIYVSGFIMVVIVSKLIGITFFLIDDIKNLFLWIYRKIFPKPEIKSEGKVISRGQFIKQSGLVMSAIPFASMMYGMVKSAFDYNVIKVKLNSPSIPAGFHGFKIVQISDIHTGSFLSSSPMKDAVKIINEQEADMVLFTGDLVNDVAEEALPFREVLKEISSKQGTFSVLGNHDYGDYFYQKGDLEGKKHNYELMQKIHHDMGWDLLLNESRQITQNGDQINLIGVENWGSSARFQKYGDLGIAAENVPSDEFNLLLSHDPSHWDAIVRHERNDIDLTLSGHTHGFQMGIEIPGYIKWSPSKYLYEQWAGLYRKENQWIYVNRGFGFLGYPGRLGILPEITVIELQSGMV